MYEKIVQTKSYSVADFIKWHNDNELELSPKYQRSNVWNDNAKSYFIDTVLRGMPIPPIFIRQTTNIHLAKVLKEIIDGQQRLRTLIDFYNNKIFLLSAHSGYETKKIYSELSDLEKEEFLSYDLPVQIVKTDKEEKIYEMFSRLNSNNFVLNKQELRNAKYWGEFKSAVYSATNEIRGFLINNKVFNDRQISRMKDYELVSNLLINIISGIVDGKDGTIEKYYKDYDHNSEICADAKSEFKYLFDQCIDILDGEEFEYFSRPTYLFTLFSIIKYLNFETDILKEKLRSLEFMLQNCDDNQPLDENLQWINKFMDQHSRHTTDKSSREERAKALMDYLS